MTGGESGGSTWPIGGVYLSMVDTNPSAFFGGTWARLGTGRMLVGVDEADPTIDAAGKLVGSKTHQLTEANLPAHTHTINHDHPSVSTSSDAHTHTTPNHSHPYDVSASNGTSNNTIGRGQATAALTTTGGFNPTASGGGTTSSDTHAHTVDLPAFSGNSGSGNGQAQAVNHMPPSMAVYMWQRTA